MFLRWMFSLPGKGSLFYTWSFKHGPGAPSLRLHTFPLQGHLAEYKGAPLSFLEKVVVNAMLHSPNISLKASEFGFG